MLNKMNLIQALILPMTAVLALPGCSGGISSTASISNVTLSSSASKGVLKAIYADLVCAQNSSCSQSPTNSGSPITNAVATGLPAGLSISAAGVISGTPTAVVAGNTYTVKLTLTDGSMGTVTARITVTLPTAVADHLVLISGNSQSGSPGAALSQSLRVQVQDQYNNAWVGGVTLGLMRMLGIDNTAYSGTVVTDSSGYASFPVSLGYSPAAWQVVPMGSTLNNSSQSKIGFTATPITHGNGTFAAPAFYATGARPWGVIVADFNGDGKADMALPAQNSNVLSLLMGNGDGTFAAKVDYTTGTQPRKVAQGDFNGDGNLDLVVSNFGSGTVSLFLGNGNGTFKPKSDFATGTAPTGIQAGDFNGDGKLDVVTADYTGGAMNVLIGNGNGTFQAAVNYALGVNPYDAVVADFNGDRILDVGVTNFTSATVSILIGNGDGTFKAKVDNSTDLKATGIKAADLNGDGNLDLAVATDQAGPVNILIGNGNGTFHSSVVYSTGANSNTDVVVADFNGDGILDVATGGGFANNSIYVMTGVGDGTFSAFTAYGTGQQPKAIGAGDFNGDGKIDLAVGCYTDNVVYAFLGN